MPALNQVNIMGNLTRDPEVKYLANGTAVCDMGMAINERTKRGDEWIDQATFVDVTLFGRTAEVAGEYLAKGAPVLIVGKLRLDQWEKDGKKFSKLKVVGDSLQMLGGKSEPRAERRDEDQPAKPNPATPVNQDDIPFLWMLPFIAILGGLPWIA
jgi:single-strand DNA-binding protein